MGYWRTDHHNDGWLGRRGVKGQIATERTLISKYLFLAPVASSAGDCGHPARGQSAPSYIRNELSEIFIFS